MDPNENNPATPPPANNTPPSATPPANPPTPPATGGETPPANQPPANPPANQPSANTPPADGDGQKPQGEGGTPPAKDPGDLYDMLKGEEQKAAEGKEAAKAGVAEYIAAAGLGNEVTDITLGEGDNTVTLPAEDVAAVLTALKIGNVPAEQAKGVLATVATLDHVRAAREAAETNKAISALQDETRQEFGDNLRQALGDTQAAGLAIFGAELWGDIMSIKALTNDKRFIRAMSAIGRGRRNDSGGPPPNAAAAPGGDKTFDLSSFAKGMK